MVMLGILLGCVKMHSANINSGIARLLILELPTSLISTKFSIGYTKPHTPLRTARITLVTQPMLQLRPNCTELRLMDYYHQIFCRFRKCKRKVPPPSPLSNDFEKSWFFSKILVMFFIFFANKKFSTI